MKGIVALCILLLGAFVGFISISLMTAVLLTIPSIVAGFLGDTWTFGIAKRLRRVFSTVTNHPIGWWQASTSLLLCRFLGIRLVAHFSNSTTKAEKPAIVFDRIRAVFNAQRLLLISNHPTTLDWIFLWTLYSCVGNVGKMKICLKKSLARLPLFGWGSQTCPYIFLARRQFNKEKAIYQGSELTEHLPGQDDIQTIKRSMAHFNQHLPYIVLLFPEGSDLSDLNRKKGHAFAKEKGLPQFDYVLIPRRRGYTAFVQEFPREGSRLVDVTMAYVGHVPGERPTEKTVFLQGRSPREVHFLIEQPEIEYDEAKIEEQLRCTFERKEKWLRTFHTEGPPQGGTDFTSMIPIWQVAPLALLLTSVVLAFYLHFSLMSLATLLSFCLYINRDMCELVLCDTEEKRA